MYCTVVYTTNSEEHLFRKHFRKTPFCANFEDSLDPFLKNPFPPGQILVRITGMALYVQYLNVYTTHGVKKPTHLPTHVFPNYSGQNNRKEENINILQLNSVQKRKDSTLCTVLYVCLSSSTVIVHYLTPQLITLILACEYAIQRINWKSLYNFCMFPMCFANRI